MIAAVVAAVVVIVLDSHLDSASDSDSNSFAALAKVFTFRTRSELHLFDKFVAYVFCSGHKYLQL